MNISLLKTRSRLLLFFTGLLFYLSFFGLTQTDATLNIGFFPGFTNSTTGEVYFWLASTFLLFPGTFMIGMALAPECEKFFDKVVSKSNVDAVSERRMIVLVVFLYSVVAYRLLHFLVLNDYPVTDDEYSAMFGGQVIAGGHFSIPRPELFEAFPKLYLFQHEGRISSFDWPGVQIFWALDEILSTGHMLFAVAAACLTGAIVYYACIKLGNRYGVLAAVLASFSPMAFALSYTTHAHLLSRGALAGALVIYGTIYNKPTRLKWSLIGVLFGFSFICRTFETAALALPVIADIIILLIKRRQKLSLVAYALPGVIAMLTVFAIFNYNATGVFWLPPRVAPNELLYTSQPGHPAFQIFHDSSLLLGRFGANFAYNLFMLLIWFLGPIGMVLIAFGATANRFTKLLLICVFSNLLIALFHDNYGLHIVGPIHYSECVVPLLLIAVHGVGRMVSVLQRLTSSINWLVSGIVMALVLGLGTFNAWHALALRQSTQYQVAIYSTIDRLADKEKPSIVIAPPFHVVWRHMHSVVLPPVGSFVFEWRKVHPHSPENVMILHDELPGGLSRLRDEYPEREIYRLVPQNKSPYLSLKIANDE